MKTWTTAALLLLTACSSTPERAGVAHERQPFSVSRLQCGEWRDPDGAHGSYDVVKISTATDTLRVQWIGTAGKTPLPPYATTVMPVQTTMREQDFDSFGQYFARNRIDDMRCEETRHGVTTVSFTLTSEGQGIPDQRRYQLQLPVDGSRANLLPPETFPDNVDFDWNYRHSSDVVIGKVIATQPYTSKGCSIDITEAQVIESFKGGMKPGQTFKFWGPGAESAGGAGALWLMQLRMFEDAPRDECTAYAFRQLRNLHNGCCRMSGDGSAQAPWKLHGATLINSEEVGPEYEIDAAHILERLRRKGAP